MLYKGRMQRCMIGKIMRKCNSLTNHIDPKTQNAEVYKGRTQRVTLLNLPSLNLVGSISPHIGNLSFLRRINLINNSFHGEIPMELGRLFRLQQLLLSNNSLDGEIPSNLSFCSNFSSLRLNYNNLVGRIPKELGSLSKLETLPLNYNHLVGSIPSSLGNLSSLRILCLAYNNLEGSIPDTLGGMSSLTFLRLSDNNFTGTVPALLFNISSIVTLSLVENQLSGKIPPDSLHLPNIDEFFIGKNKFSGPFPDSLANASSLKRLDISANEFTGKVSVNLEGLPGLLWLNLEENNLGGGLGGTDDLSFLTNLINCSGLQVLGLGGNIFGGVIPNSISNLSTTLMMLNLGRNQSSGSIPEGILNLVNLTSLVMGDNQFTDSIPGAIGKLQKLQMLDFQNNQLSGKIPASIGNLTKLYVLTLQQNNLQGRIPSSLKNCQGLQTLDLSQNKNCQGLQTLDLSQNKVSGNISEHVTSLFSLLNLDLSRNSFTDSTPLEVGNLRNLELLDVSNNNLSGRIPTTLGNCLSLEYLSMQNNSLQGEIPRSLDTLKVLKVLNLSCNKLNGGIPQYLVQLPYLESLNLSFNELEGELPLEGIFKNASEVSVVGNTKLCGGIPELKLGQCKRNRKTISIKVIVPVTVVILCIILLSCLYVKRHRKNISRRKPSTSPHDHHYLRVSYAELHKITNGFSEDNLIGVGNYGSVYKGILDEKKVVAVKVLKLERRGATKSFMSECNALRKVRHRNLVKILTSCSGLDFQGNDFKALVFELLPNGSLENWLRQSWDRLHEPKTLDLGQRLSIAMALDYLHNQCPTTIVHSDLKPRNVLLDENMTAQVADFGLAKIISSNLSNLGQSQSSVAIKGTIGYVPPEYGMGGEVTTLGDVYSYGILVLEMFTGKRPTHDMFSNGFSLHSYVKMALPDQVMEIIDKRMLVQNGNNEVINNISDRIRESLILVLRIGVACSVELPNARMKIEDVVKELHIIREAY